MGVLSLREDCHIPPITLQHPLPFVFRISIPITLQHPLPSAFPSRETSLIKIKRMD
jgi:hypothetical protein